MANKAISELPQALNVNNQDLFVLEQSGIAKKLTAETFITEQGIIDALAEALDGHGGISSVTLSSVSGRIRTYLITFTDETTTTFQVLDGTSIDRITKTSTAGLVDTYTIFMSDGTTSFFQVTNGSKGDPGVATDEQVTTAVDEWLGENVMQETGYVLDRTLSMSNAAAPADLVGDLKSAITKKMVLVYSDNKWNPNNTKSGYMTAAGVEGDNTSYEHLNDPIPVSEGDVVRSYEINAGGGFAIAGMRWLCAMDANKNAVAASGSNSNITSYTVPQGIAYINPTMNVGGQKRMITINLDATTFIDYVEPYYVATPEFTGTVDIDRDTTFKNDYLNGDLVGLLNPAECLLGKYLNPSTGGISDNASYYVTGYIPIKDLQTLYFYQKDNTTAVTARTLAAYDADKNLLDTKGTTYATSYTQSATVSFIRCCFNYSSSDIVRTPYGISIMANSNPVYVAGYGGNEIIKSEYLRPVINVKTTDTETQVIGKFVQAFEAGGCDVVFERGNYSFGTVLAVVADTFHLYENEIPIGNNCRYFFNGSTLSASIDLSTYGNDYLCNFFGTQKRPSPFEMYDGVLIANDTVYVMHDESAAKPGTYKHIYQNMEMHYVTTSRTDNIRKCIGGGTGESGVVEIIGCKFVTDGVSECVAFHGNGTDIIGARFDLNIRNSWLSNGLRVNQMSANQTARVFYAGNSAAISPVIGDRVTLTDLCNEYRT